MARAVRVAAAVGQVVAIVGAPATTGVGGPWLHQRMSKVEPAQVRLVLPDPPRLVVLDEEQAAVVDRVLALVSSATTVGERT